MKRLLRERHPYLHEFLPFMSNKGKVLDLGCGLLPNTKYLIDKGIDVVSLDFNFKYLLYGEKIARQTSFVNGDALFLPFKRNIFNEIIVVDLLEHFHLSAVGKVLSEIIRVSQDHSYIFLHIPLEGSFAYCFLRLLRKIWVKDPEHKCDFKYWQIRNILKSFPLNIEREWVDNRLHIFKNPDISAVSVTFIMKVRKEEEQNY